MTSIKVTEAATVFRGEETIYHYDFPAAGILEGWAIPGIQQKLAELGGELELPIEGEHPAVDVLTQALTCSEQSETSARPEQNVEDSTPTHPALALSPFSQLRVARSAEEASRFRVTWFHAVIAVVVLIVIAASCWAIQFTTSQGVVPREDAGLGSSGEAFALSTAQESETLESSPPAPDTSQDSSPQAGQGLSLEAGQGTVVPESVLLETDLLRSYAPQGFQAVPENGGWVLSGEDSDLRIHLIVNRVFGVPPEEMFKEIHKTVENDPALSEFTEPSEDNPKASYLENPGDGSQVRWVIWFSGDNEISVGCQTRTVPTLVQKAACSMVADSTVLKADSGGAG